MWDFAAGCMRNYLILKEKARRFAQDAAIQALLAEIRRVATTRSARTRQQQAERIRSDVYDREALAARQLPVTERLDQLVVDLLMGVSRTTSAECVEVSGRVDTRSFVHAIRDRASPARFARGS